LLAASVFALVGAATSASAASPPAPGASPAAAAPTGTVTIVHAVRGLVADVYVDGKLALRTFQPERVTDPIPLASGAHSVEVRTAGAPGTAAALLAGTIDVSANKSETVVVHPGPTGAPTITTYVNDLSKVPLGKARVVVRHAAAGGPVDVSVDGSALAPNLANSQEASAVIAAGTHTISINAAGTTTSLATPRDLSFAEGTADFLYLIGSQPDGTLAWIAQRVDNLQSTPALIPTGNSGLRATNPRHVGNPAASWWRQPLPLVTVLGGAVLVLVLLSERKRRHEFG